MKQTKTKLLCLLLAMPMLLSSLTACGKDKAKDSNLIKLGDYELLYKGACIMEDSDGNDAIVLTLDFTNNGKEKRLVSLECQRNRYAERHGAGGRDSRCRLREL